ncbi:MAG: hypothetical protein IPG10_07525 [Flavobacteriales bacterium]|nr:hypothetical protein [Flavobacteriales bacterium]
MVAGYSDNGPNVDFAVVRYNADGTLDTSFSADGMVTTAIGTSTDMATSVAIQPDEKIVVAGYTYNGTDFDFAVVRYHADGTLDGSFSADGKVTTALGASDQAFSVALQPDGRIVVVGYSGDVQNDDFAVVRYNADGTLDTSFSADGKVTTAIGTSNDVAGSVSIQPNGRIVVAGSSIDGSDNDFAVVRYNADGTLDTSFSADGKVTTAIGASNDVASSVAIQPDGRIVAAGSTGNGPNADVAVVRYNADGSLDTSFSADGMVTTDTGHSLLTWLTPLPYSPMEHVAAGSSSTGTNLDFAVVRYLSGLNAGVIDLSGPGARRTDIPQPVGQ